MPHDPPTLSRTLLLTSAIAVSFAACTPAPDQPTAASVSRLDGTTIDSAALTAGIAQLTRDANVHGLTVTVFNHDTIVYSRAFGSADLSTQRPLRTDTEMYGASLSKAVFSVIVMHLVEEGVLDLDKPLQDYFDEPLWKIPVTTWHEDLSSLEREPLYRRLTARLSLSHTTGFPNWRFFEPDEQLRIAFAPGERFRYSGEGMTLLQVVVERLTGKTLEQLAQQYVFTPYGMTTSSYTWQPRFETDYAVGHRADGSVYPKDKDNDARAPSTLETSTDDLARFFSGVLRGEGLRDDTWQEMFSPQIRIRGTTQFPPGDTIVTTANDNIELSYGLGWGLQRTPYGWGAFKEGHGDGFQHYAILYRDAGIGVLLVSNSDNAESIFGHLLRLTIADKFTPLAWEYYLPYDSTSGPAGLPDSGP